jgi:hypothetical protein
MAARIATACVERIGAGWSCCATERGFWPEVIAPKRCPDKASACRPKGPAIFRSPRRTMKP